MRYRFMVILSLAIGCCVPAAVAATSAPAAKAASGSVVYTRGDFRGRSRQGGRDYVHIKIAAGQKIPFSVLTFRVADVVVPTEVEAGTLVEFRAERVDGENVLLEIRRVAR
jgi:hypothetical protein